MSIEQGNEGSSRVAPQGGPWAHVLVSASACVLTVSIVGSAVFLTHRLYTRYQMQGKIRDFLGSLENRSPAELDDEAAQLKQRPKLVEQMMPEYSRTLRASRSEQQLCAAIRISRPFISHKRIIETLFELRSDGRENVAAAAVGMLAAQEPAEKAASVLGRCMEDVPSGAIGPAALDRLCAGLFQLGAPGLETMKKHVNKLSTDRRVWLAGYVDQIGGPHRSAWLAMLALDADPRVRAAATLAQHPTGGRVSEAMARGG